MKVTLIRMLLPCLLAALLLPGCTTAVVTGTAAGASIIHDRRTAGTIIEDQTIELHAVKLFNDDPGISGQAHLNVTSYNTIVLITGEAPTPELRAHAEELVRWRPAAAIR